jgi:hypothetical protein
MSGTARFGAVWIFGMGIFILGLAAYGIASSRWACDTPPEYPSYQFVCDVAWVLGAVAAGVGALHVMAAASIWRSHLRGALAGVVLSLLGLLTCTGFLEDERWWVVPPIAAGYLGTLLVLAYALIQGRPKPDSHSTQPHRH